jgi:CheY-like chemotaxis protein
MTKFYEGVGLGLSICYSLVKTMGGNIWYESDLGLGTTFYFTAPYEDNKNITITKAKKTNKSEIPNLEDKQILIVEDDETNYKLLVLYLAKTKANLTWAKDGLEALEHFKSNNIFDLILMDLKLPVMNGIEATTRIREINPDQLIVAQTAFVSKEEKAKFLKYNFNGYIEKPIMMENLIKILNEVFCI